MPGLQNQGEGHLYSGPRGGTGCGLQRIFAKYRAAHPRHRQHHRRSAESPIYAKCGVYAARMPGARRRSDCTAAATQLLSHFGTAARHEMSKGDNKGGSRKIIDLRCLRNLKPAARFFLHVSKTKITKSIQNQFCGAEICAHAHR